MKNVPPSLSFVCPKIGEPMRQDGPGRRFCDHCQLHIHDLSAMSRTEGERFLARTQGRVCISYLTGADGAMIVRTRWSGWKRRWNDLRRGLIALLATLAPLAYTSCSGNYRGSNQATGGVYCDPKDAHDGKDTLTPPITGQNQSNENSSADVSPPAPTPRPDNQRLTGRIGHP